MTEAKVGLRSALTTLRPRQWSKNVFVFAPLVFARAILERGLIQSALLAFVAFSFLASGVYVLNDWFDRDKDKLHPEKRLRPIAAGLVTLPTAMALLLGAWGVAFGVGAWIGMEFVKVELVYVVMQILYTFALKRLVILDVMVIALGFILRVYSGAVAIDVSVSNWLFLCTLLLALFLGFAKRRAELASLEGDAQAHRKNLADYSLPMIDQMMSISAASAILAYGLYTVSKETVEHVHSDNLKYTVPFVVYAIFRYLFLVHKKGMGGSPDRVLLTDRPFIINLLCVGAIAAWVLYAR